MAIPDFKDITIGFLLESLNNKYSNQMFQGVHEASRELGTNLIHYVMYRYYLKNKDQEYNMETIYKIIEKSKLDGLIFVGWWQKYDTEEQCLAFKKRFSNLQLLSLGRPLYAIPSVYMDGGIYLAELINHLIKVHNLKKIVCIPPLRPDSRITIYREVLTQYGFYDPKLDLSCELLDGNGIYNTKMRVKKALDILLNKRKIKVEAIISLNSSEAAEFVKQLQQLGFRIPDDIAVTSYEDGDDSKFIIPALTTIYYPFYELGYEGSKKLIRLIRQEPEPFETKIPSRLIYRSSCGCTIADNKAEKNQADKAAEAVLYELTNNEKHKLSSYLNTHTKLPHMDEWLELVFSGLDTDKSYAFIITFEKYLQDYSSNVDDVQSIARDIHTFKKTILQFLKAHVDILLKFEDMWYQLQVLILDRIQYLLGVDQLLLNNRNTIFNKISQDVITTFNLNVLLDVFAENLKILEIPSCFLFRFNETGDTGIPDYNLILAYKDNQRIDTALVDPVYWKEKITCALLSTDTSRILLLNQLHVNFEQIGFIIYEPGPVDERLFHTLSIHLSTALKGAFLVEKYQAINQELKSTQKEVVEHAFKVGMANIALGTLHNAGNILNNINTSVHALSIIANKLSASGLEKTINLIETHKHDLPDFFANDSEVNQFVSNLELQEKETAKIKDQFEQELIRSNEKLNLITNLIISQQKYAGIKEIKEQVNALDVINDAVAIMESTLKKQNIQVIREINDSCMVSADKTKLIHIFINLLTNSIEALSETAVAHRKIIFSSESGDIYQSIKVTDTGIGIEEKIKNNLFRMGFSTKKAGRGFGLHTCANYMLEMGGQISAGSEGINRGAFFLLQFPKSGEESR